MNEFQIAQLAASQQQLAPQGFLGGLIGGPLGGLVGRGIGGLLGNPNLGNRIGQLAGGIGGSLLPFGADPVAAAYAQQAQLAPQGIVGDLIGAASQYLPFGTDPVTAAYAQQAQLAQHAQLAQAQLAQAQLAQAQAAQQLAPQGWVGNFLGQVGQPVGSAIGGVYGNAALGGQIGGAVGGLARRFLPFSVDPLGTDPVTAAYAQQQALAQAQAQATAQAHIQAAQAQALAQAQAQAQLAPQGFFGDLIGTIAQPVGQAVGGLLGNARVGGQIGGIAGQLGRRFLPFSADPVAAAYAQQQAQLAPQGFFGDLIGTIAQPVGQAVGGLLGNARVGGQIGGIAGQLGRRFLPFSADPVTAAYAQQQAQLAPQGFFGDLVGTIAQPVGQALGGWLGNANLGGQIGNVAGQLGRSFIPFTADPVAAAYAQQQLQQNAIYGGVPPYIAAGGTGYNGATLH